MLVADASRGILISFTAYSPKADLWTSNYVLYEYGFGELVISNFVRSYPFRPNFYESNDEQILFILDIIRITLTLVIVLSTLITKVITQVRYK
jgi:predicted acyltransferase